MKAIIWTGTLAAFIVIYSWVLVFSVVHRTQKRIDDAVAQERARCELRLATLKAQLPTATVVEETETVDESVAVTPLQEQNANVEAGQAGLTTVSSVGAEPEKPQVPFEAQAAARAKYVEGLNYFNHDNYPAARQLWLDAVQLDPTNVEAQMGLTKVEELLKE